jgi:hypothetical protein
MTPWRTVVFSVLAVALAGASAWTTGCTDGTTPVCDDAGSCLSVPPSSSGGEMDGPADGGAAE